MIQYEFEGIWFTYDMAEGQARLTAEHMGREYAWRDERGRYSDAYMRSLLDSVRSDMAMADMTVYDDQIVLGIIHPLVDTVVEFALMQRDTVTPRIWHIWYRHGELRTDAPCEAKMVKWLTQRDDMKTLADVERAGMGLIHDQENTGLTCGCCLPRSHPKICSFIRLQKMLIELGYELMPADPNVCFAIDAPHNSLKMVSFRWGRKLAANVDADTYCRTHMGLPYVVLCDGTLAVYEAT